MPSPSVQLYSIRDAIDADLDAAIARLATVGLTKVEAYAFHLRTTELKRALTASGFTVPSGHASVIDAEEPAVIFEAAVELGMTTVIDPFIPTDRWQTADDAKRLADAANALAAQAQDAGLQFGYHNHQWEFANKVDGRSVFEIFVEHLEPDVKLEVDTFWSTVGGADTPAVLRSLGDRVVAIHVKDGKITGDIADVLPSSDNALIVPDALQAAFDDQTPAGQGDVDVNAILAAAPHALRVIEFDSYREDVFDGIAQSFAWLNDNDTEGAA